MSMEKSAVLEADVPSDPSAPRPAARGSLTLQNRSVFSAVLFLILVLFWVFGWLRGATFGDLLSLTIWGIMLGGIIALGAIGLTLVYGVLKFPNFAHGELVTIGAYCAFGIMGMLPQGPALRPFSFGWELIAAMILALPIVAAVALVVDRVLFYPLRRRNASLVLFAMASLAGTFFLRSVIYLIWGSDFHFYYPGRANPALHLPFGIRVQADQIFIFVLAIILVGLVYLLLEHSRMGKAMRATANNPDLAQVRGINTERVIAWTWVIGGALAAAGGVMYALASQLRPEMGFFLLLPIFAAAIMGGVGSPIGALVGAIIIGIAEQLSASFLNPAYGPAVAFLLMIVVLVIQPQGLFGQSGK
ncbi:MAG: branched-chain amino acid ABC transporter permease [Rhizobiaceae bacterium]|nr:MAG: branched-chain amino acid ABC transporter permease [Rhizobiaceae bacterium]